MGMAAIIGLVMAIVGTATQMYAQNQAQKAAQARMNEGYMQQRNAQDKINQKIAEATAQYQTGNREGLQSSEAQRIANDIKTDVSESQAIRNAQQATAGNVSEDYKTSKESSNEDVAAKMNAFADLIGQIRSAGTMRQQEGWNTNRHLQDIQMIGRNAQGNMMVAQDEAQQALNSKNWLKNIGALTSAAGSALTMGAAAGAGASAASTGATASSAGLGGAAGVDAVSKAATVPTFWDKAGLMWNGLSPAAKVGIASGASTFGSKLAGNPWRN